MICRMDSNRITNGMMIVEDVGKDNIWNNANSFLSIFRLIVLIFSPLTVIFYNRPTYSLIFFARIYTYKTSRAE